MRYHVNAQKIFIQQSGRELRISEHKEHVTILDFATDFRRAAAIKRMKDELLAAGDNQEIEILAHYKNDIYFSDQRAEDLINQWIKDAASLDTQNDEAKLKFPSI